MKIKKCLSNGVIMVVKEREKEREREGKREIERLVKYGKSALRLEETPNRLLS